MYTVKLFRNIIADDGNESSYKYIGSTFFKHFPMPNCYIQVNCSKVEGGVETIEGVIDIVKIGCDLAIPIENNKYQINPEQEASDYVELYFTALDDIVEEQE